MLLASLTYSYLTLRNKGMRIHFRLIFARASSILSQVMLYYI